MTKKQKKNKIKALEKQNIEYQKQINELCSQVKKLRTLIYDNVIKIEQYEKEILFD